MKMIHKATKSITGIVFSAPRMSRSVLRDMWYERFVVSMLMDDDGEVPESYWSLIDIDNCPDEIEFLPAHFDVLVIATERTDVLMEKYQEYRAFMAKEYGDYAEMEIEDFLPEIPCEYTTTEKDVQYTLEDSSSREALVPFYEDVDEELEEEV